MFHVKHFRFYYKFTFSLPTVPTYVKPLCYYITKEEMNLPPSSRLEISSCNRTTSFHHTPLLYWALRPPIAKPLFSLCQQKLVRSTGRREKKQLTQRRCTSRTSSK